MANTYLYSYGSGDYGAGILRRDRAFIVNQPQWKNVHPVLMERLFALCDAVIAAGGDYGFGGGWRSSEQQKNLFVSRYTRRNYWTSLYWDGSPSWPELAGYYEHTSGASSAPPGRSYHESTTNKGLGLALAADMVGNHAIGNALAAQFGLKHFANVNSEPWHYQPVEIPNARRNYNGEFENVTSPPPTQTPGDSDMEAIKPTRVYDSRGEGLKPFKPGEARLIPVVMGDEAHIAGGVQNTAGEEGWWAYNIENKWDAPTSFVNAYGDGRWYNFSIPVVTAARAGTPKGHIWVKSLAGGDIYIDTYAQG